MTLVAPRFDKAQVLVVGDLMLDRYWHGSASRISPEAPVPIVNVGQSEDRIGGAGNVALNIASLGAGAFIVGVVGKDDAAESLRTRLISAGIHCDFQVSETKPTITKLRVISRHQQLLRLDFEELFTVEDCTQLPQKAEALLSNVGALVLSDYAKGALNDPQVLIAMANKHGVPVLVDPK